MESKLQETLTKLKFQNSNPEFGIVDSFEQELAETDIITYALKTGDKIPQFFLPNAKGLMIDIMDFPEYKWLVISFYRGQWCPYCNLELRALEKALSQFEKFPAKLVAISPQTPDNSLTTVQKNNLTFEVLSDVESKVAKQFKIVYTIPEYMNELYKKYGVDFQFFNGKGKIELPMPATYVVDKEGIIRQHFISTLAHERLDPQDVVRFLDSQS